MAKLVREIKLTRGLIALVDDEDYDRVGAFAWYASPVRGRNVYAMRNMTGPGARASEYMYRFVLSAPPGEQVDHINCNGLDNRRDNLRLCSGAQNMRNTRKTFARMTSSRFKGVTWDERTGLWIARLVVRGRQRFTRRFNNEESAARYYDEIAVEVFGDFARTNFGERSCLV